MNIAIVGANRGIGLEFVNQLAGEHSVYAFCRTASEELKSSSAKQIIENCDVSQKSSLDKAVEALEADSLDWLIHVAGIKGSATFENFDVDDIQKQFLVNSIAPILSTKAFLPKLRKGSKVGLLSSRTGSVGDNSNGGMHGYRMSKSALNMGASCMAMDIEGKGIAVLMLHPGYVRTDMTDHNGDITTQKSVDGLLKIMQSKSLKDTGTFWHTNGEEIPW